MTDKEIRKNAERNAKERFSTHKATIVTDTDRYLAIDWRRGESIAVWYNRVEPAKLKDWIYNDIGYYIGKIRTRNWRNRRWTSNRCVRYR